jgi:hypothetical protein
VRELAVLARAGLVAFGAAEPGRDQAPRAVDRLAGLFLKPANLEKP